MNMELFSSIQEGKDFLNYKANKRINKLEDLCVKNQTEIDKNIEKCGLIFSKYETENHIEELLKFENSKAIPNEEEYNRELEKITNKINEFLENLITKYNEENIDLSKKMEYLSDKEDIEFAMKKINNRKVELEDKKGLIEKIENEFSTARSFNVNNYLANSITFKMINDFLNNEKETNIETEEIKEIEPLTSELYVVKIEEAPEELKIKDSEEETSNEEIVTSTVQDTSFFGIDDNLTEAILNDEKIDFKEVEEETPTPFEVENVAEDAKTIIDNNENEVEEQPLEVELEKASNLDIAPAEIKLDTINEEVNSSEPVNEVVQEETNIAPTTTENSNETSNETASEEIPTIEKVEEPKEENNLTYTIDENDTISSIGAALFPEEKLTNIAIKRIIEENKEVINQKLQEKNLKYEEKYNNEPGILTGITLNLSNVFDKVIEDSKNL